MSRDICLRCRGTSHYSGGGIRTRDLRVMSPNLGPAGLRGARFQAVFARSDYVEIGWSLWGFLPHFLPSRTLHLLRRLSAQVRAAPGLPLSRAKRRQRVPGQAPFRRGGLSGGVAVIARKSLILPVGRDQPEPVAPVLDQGTAEPLLVEPCVVTNNDL